MSDVLRVLVVDDELIARKRLSRLLAAMSDVEIAGECEDGEEVAPHVKDGGVDVVLLDIQMARVSGIEAMGVLDPDDPVVVFVTAHPSHAVEAFDGGAADYLLKPVEPARLKKALDRARERLELRRMRSEPHAPAPPSRLAVPTRRGLVLVDPNEIRYALIEGETVLLHTTRGTFVTDFRIAALEKKLAGDRFERVHRRVLLNLDHVASLEPLETGGYIAITTDGGKVPISRQSARRLRRRWALPGA